MSTTSTSASTVVASPLQTRTSTSNRTVTPPSGSSFSSQVAAVWNQSSFPSSATGSASSASLNHHPVASSMSASRLAGKTGTEIASKAGGTQTERPASMSQTVQPASGRGSQQPVKSGGGPAAEAGTADAAGSDDLPVEDDSTTDAPQPELRGAAGASARPARKPAQATGARPDDATTAAVLSPLPLVGACLPPAHPVDAAKEPTTIGPDAGLGTTSNGSRPVDDPEQPVSIDSGQVCVALDQHAAHGEAPDAGAGSQVNNHHGVGSVTDVPVHANAADPTTAHDATAASSQPAVEPMALATSTIDVSLPTAAGASSTMGSAPAPAATAADATGAPAQVGASLLTLASSADGSSQMALSLHPKDLGEVHIQLARGADGAVRVVVAATEPATLRSLIADQAHLHVALDAAAVPSINRHVSFELAPGAAPPDAGASADGQPNGSGSAHRDAAMDMAGQNGGRRSGDGRPDHPDGPNTAAESNGGFDRSSPFSSTTTLLLRQGSINITA